MPLPDTPVTAVITPKGISTSIFLRLFSAAPLIFIHLSACLRCFGSSMRFLPDRYAPVSDCLHCIISSAVPTATTSPPCSPAPGPISTIKSAARMVSSSCSTTMTELPRSLNCFNVARSLSLSLWCKPMEGSSNIYATPTSPEPICVASLMRCASPPDKVAVALARVR